MDNPTVLDISKHQGSFDAAVAKSRGINTIMCRAAYSSSQDTCFETFAKNIRANGLGLGAYYFCTWHYSSKATTSAAAETVMKAQTSNLINILKEADISSYVAIDLELESGASTSLTRAEMTSIANQQCDLLAAAGYHPIVYASISWFFDRMNGLDIKYPVWVAYYNSNITPSNFQVGSYASRLTQLKDKVVMVQYSSKGSGPYFGAESTYIDVNYNYQTLPNYSSKTTTTTASTSAAVSTIPASSFTSGQVITLNNADLYASSSSSKSVSKKTGTYYIWSPSVINGRVRITIKSTLCGVSGQVTGWVDTSAIGGVTTTKTTTTTTTTTTPVTGYTTGQAITLNNADLYASSSSTTVAGKKTGTFYVWSSAVINGRIRITIKPSLCGVSGQVTGWIAVPTIETTSAPAAPTIETTSAPAASAEKYSAGQAVTVTNNALYASSTAKTYKNTKSGTFYVYDGNCVNGRYRVTIKSSYCNKKPAAIYVTGWMVL